MGMFLKRSYKLKFKFDVYFRNFEVINDFSLERSEQSSHTPGRSHQRL